MSSLTFTLLPFLYSPSETSHRAAAVLVLHLLNFLNLPVLLDICCLYQVNTGRDSSHRMPPVQGCHCISGLFVVLRCVVYPFGQLRHKKVATPLHRDCKLEGTQCSYPYPQILKEQGHLKGTAMSCMQMYHRLVQLDMF